MDRTIRSRIRARIKGLASEGTHLRRQLRRVSKQRWLDPGKQEETAAELYNAHRDLGQEARYYLLAYGFMRGRSYTEMEATCRDNNKPQPHRILGLLQAWSNEVWTLADVERLLGVKHVASSNTARDPRSATTSRTKVSTASAVSRAAAAPASRGSILTDMRSLLYAIFSG